MTHHGWEELSALCTASLGDTLKAHFLPPLPPPTTHFSLHPFTAINHKHGCNSCARFQVVGGPQKVHSQNTQGIPPLSPPLSLMSIPFLRLLDAIAHRLLWNP